MVRALALTFLAAAALAVAPAGASASAYTRDLAGGEGDAFPIALNQLIFEANRRC